MAKGLKPIYPTKSRSTVSTLITRPNPKVRDSGQTDKPLPAGKK